MSWTKKAKGVRQEEGLAEFKKQLKDAVPQAIDDWLWTNAQQSMNLTKAIQADIDKSVDTHVARLMPGYIKKENENVLD